VNFMFKPLQGNTTRILEQMKGAIHREFYIPFMTLLCATPIGSANKSGCQGSAVP